MSYCKKTPANDDFMLFAFRWTDSLNTLTDSEFRSMINAICRYAKDQQPPEFSGAMAGLWQEYRQLIDRNRERRKKISDARSAAGKEGMESRWHTITTDNKCYQTITTDSKDNIPVPVPVPKKGTTLSSSKENVRQSELFSLPQTENFIQSDMEPTADYRRWTAEQFKTSVDTAIQANPALAPYRDEFADYWTEKDHRGRPRYQLERTWDTPRRMSRWMNNNIGKARPAAVPTQQSLEDTMAEIQREQMRG